MYGYKNSPHNKKLDFRAIGKNENNSDKLFYFYFISMKKVKNLLSYKTTQQKYNSKIQKNMKNMKEYYMVIEKNAV